jgi:hypothetical protein
VKKLPGAFPVPGPLPLRELDALAEELSGEDRVHVA